MMHWLSKMGLPPLHPVLEILSLCSGRRRGQHFYARQLGSRGKYNVNCMGIDRMEWPRAFHDFMTFRQRNKCGVWPVRKKSNDMRNTVNSCEETPQGGTI